MLSAEEKKVDRAVLNAQQDYWENTFSLKPDMFGEEPSFAAVRAAEIFSSEGKKKILELGCGQGRDTLYFASQGFEVCALDYSEAAVKAVEQKCRTWGLNSAVQTICHDLKKKLPFQDHFFDGCYSHMLYCMAFTTDELKFLNGEIRRVLKPGGLNVYTVRHTGDAHYKEGIHRGEDMYEKGGFIVHFFNTEKIYNLADGFEVIGIEEFEEGGLPRKLFQVFYSKK